MKLLYKILSSMWLMLFLTLIFAISSAIATFIENDYGTTTAWSVVYGARWFEVLQLLLGLNLLLNIYKYKMYKSKNLPLFIFHAGFLVILIGAAITRYIGYEGLMHIREGQKTNQMVSLKPYLQVWVKKDNKKYYFEKQQLISKISSNYFKYDMNIDNKKAIIEFKDFIPNVKKVLVEDKTSPAKIKMMIAGNNAPEVIILDSNKSIQKEGIVISLNKKEDNNSIVIKSDGDKFFIKSPFDYQSVSMATREFKNFKKGIFNPFELKHMYNFGTIKLTPIKIYAHAKEKLISQKIKGGKNIQSRYQSALIVNIKYDGKDKDIKLFGYGDSRVSKVVNFTLGDANFSISWGAKIIKLPFYVKLKHFELKRYPGSNSPASYASYVTVYDKDRVFDYKIYMNHVLDYKGYRLFQSSYDMDEKGTVLSVNHDPGKIPTYIGYIMLAIGFILNFFNPKSRFRKLVRMVQKDSIIKSFVIFATLFSLQTLKANPLDEARLYDKAHCELFGDLLVQKHDGRIVPLDSFARDLLLKISKKDNMYGLDVNQILLGMITSPKVWQQISIIRVKHKKIKKILGLSNDKKYASYNDFFDFTDKNSDNIYKLSKYVEEATRKRPIKRNQFDRDVIKVDERLNISYLIYTGDILRIIPKINDPHQKWFSVKDAISKFPPKEASRVRTLFLYYFSQIDEAKKSKDWKSANEAVKLIKKYQEKIGKDIIPPKSQIEAEKFFTKIHLFDRLALVYFIGGFILLISIFVKLLKPTANTKVAFSIGQYIIIFGFLAHTLGLAIRWYIGGHAPWSNAYEAMVYIAWSMALAGIVFRRLSLLAPALTALIASATLFTTFLAEMDPQITNLVPVLNSYWLNIHVAVLTASYGFLGLSMILGFFTMILFMLKDKNPAIKNSIIESTRINEMTAILGLVLLTLGNFLGGVWANESWGRYWSWDPKETWAWISILVYVILTHIRLIPWFHKNYYYKFSALSLISYASIVMTFVGVNYYLSGMHSYAAGEPMPIPKYLYLIVAIVVGVIVLAYPKRELKPEKSA